MGRQLNLLKQRLEEIRHLNKASALLIWDQETKMPPGGARARAEQLATLSRLGHELFIADRTGELLARAANETADLPFDDDDASLVRVSQRDYDRTKRLPTSLVTEFTRHSVLAHEAWVRARANDDFAAFSPWLERTIELSRQRAEHLGYQENMYDALLDLFEPGIKSSRVTRIFDDLKQELVPLVAAIAERSDRVDDAAVHQPFDERAQEAFGKKIAAILGYDFSRGRLDPTVHPFETSFSCNDVRITTRYESNFLSPSLFGTMHETGHAMYEQGVSPALDHTPLGRGASSAVHESQSRMWENVVGRSRPFWQRYYPDLQRVFPQQLAAVDIDTFYGAINTVQPSLIRVYADEVTYNLHIMLRFEMEMDLLANRYPVSAAPAVWNDKMESYLGVRPPSDTLGILQDVHWSNGLFGYFPTYALGNILSLQLYDKALQERPEIRDQLARGETTGLREWMTEKIYRHGRKFQPAELVERATGEPLQSRAYMKYLQTKFGRLYGL